LATADETRAQRFRDEVYKDLVSLADVLSGLGWHRATFYRHRKKGHFRTVKIGKEAFVPLQDFLAWKQKLLTDAAKDQRARKS
jgi:predicted DNA-binding transcriptional regulator AlpA